MFSGAPTAAQPKKILFIKLIEQGATVLAYSSIKRAIDLVGRENVYFCVFDANKSILEIVDWLPKENILIIRDKGGLNFLGDTIKFWHKCRSIGIDTAVDMEFFSRVSAILSYTSGAKWRVGCHQYNSELPYRGHLLTHPITYNPYMHVAKQYLYLIEALLLDPKELPMPNIKFSDLKIDVFRYQPSESDMNAVQRKLTEQIPNALTKRLVILNPNPNDLLLIRKWPAERYRKLTEMLLETYPDVVVVYSGLPNEKEENKAMYKGLDQDRIADLTGATNFKQLLALYELGTLFISSDSGPGHFATMLNVHNIVLFGAETPDLFGPVGDRSVALYHPMVGSPAVSVFNYRLTPQTSRVGVEAISLEEVWQATQNALQL